MLGDRKMEKARGQACQPTEQDHGGCSKQVQEKHIFPKSGYLVSNHLLLFLFCSPFSLGLIFPLVQLRCALIYHFPQFPVSLAQMEKVIPCSFFSFSLPFCHNVKQHL